MTARVLVAGIGNLFLGDDGFGPEVVRRLLDGGPPPAGVRVTDYGIRGMHLAYDLLDGWDTLILVDALPAVPASDLNPPVTGEPPGGGPIDGGAIDGGAIDGGAIDGGAIDGGAVASVPVAARRGEVVVIEVGADDLEAGDFDAHGMQPVAVLGSLTAMGGKLPPTYLVGCPIESVHEGIGLSPTVAAAVPAAIDAILALLGRLPLSEPLAEPGRP